MTPDEMSLYLLIQAKDQASATLKKIKQETNNLSDSTGDAGKKMSGAFGLSQSSLGQFLRSIQQARWIIFRTSMLIGLALSPWIIGFKELAKSSENFKNISRDLGISIEEVSNKMYGVKITKKDLDNLAEFGNEWDKVGKSFTGFLMKFSSDTIKTAKQISSNSDFNKLIEITKKVFIDPFSVGAAADLTPKAFSINLPKLDVPLPEFTEKELMLMSKLKTKTEDFYLNKYALQEKASKKELEDLLHIHNITKTRLKEKKELYKAVFDYLTALDSERIKQEFFEASSHTAKLKRLQGELTSAQRIEYEIQYEEMKKHGELVLSEWRRYYSELTRMEQLHSIGLQTHAEQWNGLVRGFVGNSQNMFSDLFVAGFSGNLHTAKDIFNSFINSMQRAIADFLAQKAVVALFSAFLGFSGGGGGTKSVGGGATGGTGAGEGIGVGTFAEGGIVRRPTLALIGENGPEEIIPLGKSRGAGNNISITINAIDVQSFNDYVSRHPESIISVVQQNIQRNGVLRDTVRRSS